MEILSDKALAELAAHPPPSVGFALIHNEWPTARIIGRTDQQGRQEEEDVYLSHFGHWVEAVAAALVVEAVVKHPMPEVVICCNCGPKWNGERGLNMLVIGALYEGAPLLRCKEFNGTAGVPIAPFEFPAWTLPSPLVPPPPTPRPWALHMTELCVIDRHVAHKEAWTQLANNINARLIKDVATDEVQRYMDTALQRLRTSALLAPLDKVVPEKVEDVYGKSILALLQAPRDPLEPLVTVIYRKPPQRRSLEPHSFTQFAAAVEALTPNLLVVQAEKLTAPQQLAIASATDIMIGSQGNGMAHLFWMPMGCGVLEIMPHYRQIEKGKLIEEGTGWTNDWPFLTRLKGCSYRAVDSHTGHANPVKHDIADLAHQLHVSDLVLNVEAAMAEFTELVEEWKSVNRKLRVTKEPIRMREHWHPLYVSTKPGGDPEDIWKP